MRTYVIRRLLLFIPTLFILSMLVFFSVRLLPGDYIDILLSDPQFVGTGVDRERLSEMLGLNVPTHVAYVRWVSGILLRGTLGQSLQRDLAPVEAKILARVPVTLELARCRSESSPRCARTPWAIMSGAASPSSGWPPPTSGWA